MLIYVNKDTNETYSERAFIEMVLKPEQKWVFKNRDDFDTFLMYNYEDLWLDNEFYRQPMHIKIDIRREWFKECLYLARDSIFRLREHDIFVEIDIKHLDYK
jgi:hypothetical protein